MAIKVADVRSELQLPEQVISEADILYAIRKVELVDINLVCAEVLRMFLRRNQGRVKFKLKNYEEWVNPMDIRIMITDYMNKSTNSVFDDGIEYPDSKFPETPEWTNPNDTYY